MQQRDYFDRLMDSHDHTAELWLWIPFVFCVILILSGLFMMIYHYDHFNFAEWGASVRESLVGGGAMGTGQAAVNWMASKMNGANQPPPTTQPNGGE